jgi:hypothetical protein
MPDVWIPVKQLLVNKITVFCCLLAACRLAAMPLRNPPLSLGGPDAISGMKRSTTPLTVKIEHLSVHRRR